VPAFESSPSQAPLSGQQREQQQQQQQQQQHARLGAPFAPLGFVESSSAVVAFSGSAADALANVGVAAPLAPSSSSTTSSSRRPALTITVDTDQQSRDGFVVSHLNTPAGGNGNGPHAPQRSASAGAFFSYSAAFGTPNGVLEAGGGSAAAATAAGGGGVAAGLSGLASAFCGMSPRSPGFVMGLGGGPQVAAGGGGGGASSASSRRSSSFGCRRPTAAAAAAVAAASSKQRSSVVLIRDDEHDVVSARAPPAADHPHAVHTSGISRSASSSCMFTNTTTVVVADAAGGVGVVPMSAAATSSLRLNASPPPPSHGASTLVGQSSFGFRGAASLDGVVCGGAVATIPARCSSRVASPPVRGPSVAGACALRARQVIQARTVDITSSPGSRPARFARGR
jgi:hypothetical protein